MNDAPLACWAGFSRRREAPSRRSATIPVVGQFEQTRTKMTQFVSAIRPLQRRKVQWYNPPKPHSRQPEPPWRTLRLTTCIAAICFDEDSMQHKVILCSDRQLNDTTSGITSDVANKILDLGQGWTCMLAGNISAAERLYYIRRSNVISGPTTATTAMNGCCVKVAKPLGMPSGASK